MKAFLETISAIVLVLFLLLLFFVFSGEPKLWDLWRAAAVQAAGGCKQ